VIATAQARQCNQSLNTAGYYQVFTVRFLRFLIVLLWVPLVHAGHIELLNGDRVAGELVRVDGDNLVWNTVNFGVQSIPKQRIKNFSSSTPLKINGNRTPCIVEKMEQENLVYYCGLRSRMNRVSLLSIKAMVPYEDFVEEKYTHHGRLSLLGTYARGNEVRDEWNLQTEVSLRKSEWRHNFMGEYAETALGEANSPKKWNTGYSVDWFFRERWFWYNNMQLGADERKGTEAYYVFGSGAGYQFWESRDSALSMTLGVAYFGEEYQESAKAFEDDDTFSAGRSTMNFRHTLPWGVGFFHVNEFMQSFDASSNWRLKSTTGLSTMLISRIYSEIKLDYSIDKEPRPDKESKDTRLSLGVSYKW
jgi:hypothetical protein